MRTSLERAAEALPANLLIQHAANLGSSQGFTEFEIGTNFEAAT